jgi:cytochrome c biogenesis protein CcmG/thiol:disulfide interchange protein DsbE
MKRTFPMITRIQQAISRHPVFFSILILATSAAWIGYTSAVFPTTTNGLTPAPKEGFLAPDFTLSTPDGQVYSLSELRGRPLLINFWATWCPPCQAEMPAMQRIYKQYQEQGFLILAINATHQDNQADILDFSREYGLTFPILMDMDGTVSQQYLVHAFPSSYFVDSQGTISEVVIGGPIAEALLETRVETLFSGGR